MSAKTDVARTRRRWRYYMLPRPLLIAARVPPFELPLWHRFAYYCYRRDFTIDGGAAGWFP